MSLTIDRDRPADDAPRPEDEPAPPAATASAAAPAPDVEIARLNAERAALRIGIAGLNARLAEVEQRLAALQDGHAPESQPTRVQAAPERRQGSPQQPLSAMRASVAAPKLERLPTWVRSRRQAMLAAEQPFPVPRVEALGLRWEIALVAGILLIAAALRFWHLTSLPAGLHGDEAWTGIEGRRILREGWIGPCSPSALGQPSGPLYVTAVAVWLFGNTIFAVRLVPALMGLLTIAALYVVIRRNLGTWAALAGAALLALMDWHIHFSRIGFPLAAWPLTVVLAAGALMEALRTQDWRWWAAAGALTGLGIYAYNADPVFVAIVGLFALYT